MSLLKRLLPAVGLAILCLYFTLSARSPAGEQLFLTPQNWFAMAGQYAYLLIIGMGATVIIIAGGIDLSVGSVLALAGVVATYSMVRLGWPAGAGALAGIGVGALCGLVNGLLTARLKVPAFIATLGTLMAARGVALKIPGA